MCERFNNIQYELLLSCAEKENFLDWNNYVSSSEDMIKLRGANFEGITFSNVIFQNKNRKGADLCEASFKNATLTNIDMSKCNLREANFNGTKISLSIFQDAKMSKAILTGTECIQVDFSCANFQEAKLTSVEFFNSTFYECNFYRADLSDAKFFGGGHNPLVGKELRFNLCGATFNNAKFTDTTYFDIASVSRETDFRTVHFDRARFSTGLRQTIKYCNRRKNWIDWYEKQGGVLALIVKIFWSFSDYGYSTQRVINTFFASCLFFAVIYFLFPSLISGLEPWQPIRSVYFSVVTMTTLGFGDMYASKDNGLAQILIIFHVLLGYVLLGALITVLSHLFTSDGPAQGLVKHPDKPIGVRIGIKNT